MKAISAGKLVVAAVALGVAVYATFPTGNFLNYDTCAAQSGLSELSEEIYGRFFWERAREQTREIARGMTDVHKSLYDAARTSARTDSVETRMAVNKVLSGFQKMIAEERRCEQLINDRLNMMQ